MLSYQQMLYEKKKGNRLDNYTDEHDEYIGAALFWWQVK